MEGGEKGRTVCLSSGDIRRSWMVFWGGGRAVDGVIDGVID